MTQFPAELHSVKQYEADVETKTLLYALTADISLGTKKEIKDLPFEAVFERICIPEIAMIKR